MATVANANLSGEFVFKRDRELEELRRRVSARKAFVLHGPSGAGKTFLLRRAISGFTNVLYCPHSDTAQSVFQSLALALLAEKDRRVRNSLRNPQAIKTKSTIALRGIVLDALRHGDYWVVLDHLRGPAAALSADTRDIMFYGSTPVLAVARSAHMEDLGFLAPIFVLRSERMQLANFAPSEAAQFAEEIAQQTDLCGTNLSDFLDRVVGLSQGSPGTILRMVHMAMLPRYRIDGHIKTSPLYIDFRLAWHAENAL
jgi:hypothetical protein